MPGLEQLHIDSGVDLSFWGHEHSYERFFPIARRNVYNLTANPYYNAPAPTYIITGAAGCHSKHAYFDITPTPGSAARYNDYGYSVLHIHNHTHIQMKQISVEKKEKVIDEFWLTKDIGADPISVREKKKHTVVPFPPHVESTACHIKDPRCRFNRNRRKLEKKRNEY